MKYIPIFIFLLTSDCEPNTKFTIKYISIFPRGGLGHYSGSFNVRTEDAFIVASKDLEDDYGPFSFEPRYEILLDSSATWEDIESVYETSFQPPPECFHTHRCRISPSRHVPDCDLEEWRGCARNRDGAGPLSRTYPVHVFSRKSPVGCHFAHPYGTGSTYGIGFHPGQRSATDALTSAVFKGEQRSAAAAFAERHVLVRSSVRTAMLRP